MPKPNARTFRYSDEVKNILEHHGNDFDGLVVEAFLRLPEAKKQVDFYEKRRQELLSQIGNLSHLKYLLDNLESQFNHLFNQVEKM